MLRSTKKCWHVHFCILLACILLLYPVNSWAFSDDYVVTRADFDITINDDGSATVVETWDVDFLGESTPEFSREIGSDLPNDEKFTGIKVLDVSIDGISCSPTDTPEERPEHTYCLRTDEDYYEIDAFGETNSKTEYVISYKLKNVVKYVDQTYYLFHYRLLDEHFKKTVRQLKVHFHGPEGSALQVLKSTMGNPVINGSGADISARNRTGLCELSVRMDGPEISRAISFNSKAPSNKITPETRETIGSVLAALLKIAVMMVLATAVRYLIDFYSKYKNIKKKLKFRKHPELFPESLSIVKDKIEPAKVALTKFYLYEFARLIQLEKIRLENQYFCLSRHPEKSDAYEMEFYTLVEKVLETQTGIEHTDNWYFIDYELFEQYIVDNYYSVVAHSISFSKKASDSMAELTDFDQFSSAWFSVYEYAEVMYSRNNLYDVILNEKDPYILALLITAEKVYEKPNEGGSADGEEAKRYNANSWHVYDVANSFREASKLYAEENSKS